MTIRYTDSQRQEIVLLYQKGRSALSLCAEYGMARSTLFSWIQQYTMDVSGQIPREQYLMHKELERLRTENRIFKFCGCSPSAALSVRLNAIEKHREQFGVHALCRVLGVRRSTFYYHTLRVPEQSQLRVQDAFLKPLIAEIFKKSEGRFGARKIRAKLIQDGHTISERRIGRLMKEQGLFSKGKCPKLNSANDRQYQYYPNKLRRNFSVPKPNAVWVSDITYARVGIGFLYLCVVIDLFSRKVISYGISEHINAALVCEVLQSAFLTRGNPAGLTFHSDQGAQYTSFEFRVLLKKHGITQSFSAPGTPYDNAVAESFFATIKKEDFRRNFYRTETKFREAIERYMNFYNDYRPHQRLGFLTPNQAEVKFKSMNLQ